MDPVTYCGGDYREERDLEQVHLVIGFDGIAHNDPDYYPLAVLSTLLGGGMSSRLFQEAREKRGLVYNIYSFASSYEDGGLFGIYAGTSGTDIIDLLPVICNEVKSVSASVQEDEVARARAQKSSTLMALESTSARCEQAARQLQIYDRAIPNGEVIEKIEAVDTKAVLNAANRIFTSFPTIAAIGPIKNWQTMTASGTIFVRASAKSTTSHLIFSKRPKLPRITIDLMPSNAQKASESVGFEARRMEKIFRLKPAAGQALPVMSVQESIENVGVRLEAVGPKILAHERGRDRETPQRRAGLPLSRSHLGVRPEPWPLPL